jgi:hypothetical protein
MKRLAGVPKIALEFTTDFRLSVTVAFLSSQRNITQHNQE